MSGETSLSGFPHGFVGPGGGGHLEVLPSFPWPLRRLEDPLADCASDSPVPFGIAAADKSLLLDEDRPGGGEVWCGAQIAQLA